MPRACPYLPLPHPTFSIPGRGPEDFMRHVVFATITLAATLYLIVSPSFGA